jgi:hypothetical protein
MQFRLFVQIVQLSIGHTSHTAVFRLLMKEPLTIELPVYTDLEVLARKHHTTPWLYLLDAIRRKAGNDNDDREDAGDDGDWWKKDCSQ